MSTIGSFLIDTDDIGAAEAALSEHFGPINIGAVTGGAPSRTRIWRSAMNRLTLDEAEYTYSMEYTMAPPDKILLCRVRSGTLREILPGGDVVVHGPGRVVAFGAVEGEPIHGAVDSAVYDLFALDRRALNDVVGRSGRRARLGSSRPLSSSANQLVVDAVDYVRHGVMANAHAGREPLLAGALTNYLASALVSAFPVDTPEADTRAGLPQGTEVLVRRATAFIDENAHTAITPADIAAAANLTPRVLQMIFARHRGCSLMQYVRRVRLDHAHVELLAAEPATASVADIAQRWGFASVSRFAVAYRLQYGRSPGATLRSESTHAGH
jgi:AraC-like DNA-binding protein